MLATSAQMGGEGAAQFMAGIEQGDPGRALYGGSSVLLATAGAAWGKQQISQNFPYQVMPTWLFSEVQVGAMNGPFGVPRINLLPAVARPYGAFRGQLQEGFQANHLNQDAAFGEKIPRDEALASPLRGNAFTEQGTPHYEFHRNLESFWNQYRRGGQLFGSRPTNAQYTRASEAALRAAGETPEAVKALTEAAARQRRFYGLRDQDPVPRIPGRMQQSGSSP